MQRYECLYLLVCLLFLVVLDDQSCLAIQDDSQHLSVDIDSEPCSPWQFRDRVECKCAKSLQDIVVCQNKPYTLKIYVCYCMTYNKKRDCIVVGSCQFSCQRSKGYYFNITANTTLQMNELMCRGYNRQGQLCGSCTAGFTPPAYSYSLSCVNCTTSNWAKYTQSPFSLSLCSLSLSSWSDSVPPPQNSMDSSYVYN